MCLLGNKFHAFTLFTVNVDLSKVNIMIPLTSPYRLNSTLLKREYCGSSMRDIKALGQIKIMIYF